MQVQKINFTSAPKHSEQQGNKQSSLYNKQNFMQIGALNDFTAGSAVGFGVLESKSKFQLLSKTNLPTAELKDFAKKQTKRNIKLGLGIGVLYTIVDVFLFNKFSSKLETAFDKLEELETKNK